MERFSYGRTLQQYSFFSDVARQTGSALDTNAKEQWLWKRRRVLAYDGSTGRCSTKRIWRRSPTKNIFPVND